MLTTVRHIFGRIMHSETALCSQWDKGWKNNLLFASPSIRRPTVHISSFYPSVQRSISFYYFYFNKLPIQKQVKNFSLFNCRFPLICSCQSAFCDVWRCHAAWQALLLVIAHFSACSILSDGHSVFNVRLYKHYHTKTSFLLYFPKYGNSP